jgi:hypothetical protein
MDQGKRVTFAGLKERSLANEEHPEFLYYRPYRSW